MHNNVEFSEAIRRANQILDEEARNPTARYSLADWENPQHLPLTERQYMGLLVRQEPEIPFKDPEKFRFDSDNYKMLCVLHGMLPPGDRAGFASMLLGARVNAAPGCALPRNHPVGQPFRWDELVSELPLLTEFCVRNGARSAFLRVLAEASPMPGHAVLFRHLDDMIRFNPLLLAEEDYERISLSVSTLAAAMQRSHAGPWQLASERASWTISTEEAARKLNDLSGSVKEACRKATFLLLKRSLLSGVNLEVNQDKQAVESYLQSLGFSQALRGSLNEAERLYRDQSDGFTLKSSMGHLRSFLENLHKEKMPVLHAKYGGPLPSVWGDGLAYLRKNGVISESEEKFAAGLYVLISDQAVHPVMAERDYARLARNVVIEYGLLFLRNIEKLGLAPGG